MIITCEHCRQTYEQSQPFCPNCAQANRYYEKPEVQAPVYSQASNSTSSTSTSYQPSPSTVTEGDTTIYWIIGFFFWFVGIILYFALVNRYPKAAQSALNGSLTIIVIGIVLAFLANIF
jgi:hypothetical protein